MQSRVVVIYAAILLVACNRLSPMEKKIVGPWQWTYIEGIGHETFTPDHKITMLLEPEPGHSTPSKDQETVVTVGTWRLEGDVLIIATDNEWLRAMYSPPSRHIPALEKRVERHRIIRIDNEKMVCEDGYTLDRAK